MGRPHLKRNAEDVPDFLSGREFSRQEIQEIQETVRVCWRLSWKDLVQTICEHLAATGGAGIGEAAKAVRIPQRSPFRCLWNR